MRAKRKVAALVALALALAAVPLPATEREEPAHRGAITFVFENDLFAGNDTNYTNGLSLGVTSADVAQLGSSNFFSKTAGFFSFLPTVGQAGYRNHVGYRLAQEMYTPNDISTPAPLPGEHPYAGVLMADVTLFSKTPEAQHAFLFALGVVGPASGAEQVQKLIHRWTGSPEPMGWDTQLSNELLVNLGYTYDHRIYRKASPGGGGIDLSAGLGAALGNYLTGAQGSVILRFGHDVPDTFGRFDIRSGSSASVTLAPPPEKFRFYGTLGLSAAGVARFLPTDGNTFTESLSGDRDDFYAIASAGIVAGYRNLSLLFIYNSMMGDTRRPGYNEDDYGSLSLTWFF